jgi:putative FmdB family regulatory protein
MPIYEYECTHCGHVVEAIQKFSDKPLKKCRHCSGKLQRLISQSSFHLKGTGWYVTDYSNRTSSTAAANRKSDTSAAPSAGSDNSTPKATSDAKSDGS